MYTLDIRETTQVTGADGNTIAGAAVGTAITAASTAIGTAIAGPVGAIIGASVGAAASTAIKENLPAVGNALAHGLEVASHNQHRHDLPGGGMPIAFQ